MWMGSSAAIPREDAMVKSSKSGREQAREWSRRETDQQQLPPDPTDIRSQLGWTPVECEYDDRRSHDFVAHLIA